MQILKTLFFSSLIISAAPVGANAKCLIPNGIYKHLYSDMHEAYYYSDTTTIRIDAAGNKIVKHGDFDLNVHGNRYKRAGNTFTFVSDDGSYTQTVSNHGKTPIYFTPSDADIAASITYLTPGSNYRDEYGVYMKQPDGLVTYHPHSVTPDLVINDPQCSMASNVSVIPAQPAVTVTVSPAPVPVPALAPATHVVATQSALPVPPEFIPQGALVSSTETSNGGKVTVIQKYSDGTRIIRSSHGEIVVTKKDGRSYTHNPSGGTIIKR